MSAADAAAQVLEAVPPPAAIPPPAEPLGPPPPVLVRREPELTLAQKVVRALVILAAAVAIGLVLRTFSFLIAPVALAFLAFYVLSPLVNLLERHGTARTPAVLLCFGLVLSTAVGLGFALWPTLEAWLRETPRPGERSVFEVQLAHRLDAWEASLRASYPGVGWQGLFEDLRRFLDDQRRGLMEALPAMLLGALSSAGTFILAPVIAVYLLLDGAAMHRTLLSYVPNRHFETVLVLLHRVDRQIAGYLRGAASEAGLVAALLAGVLWLVGMPNALLFACLFAIANVIPLVGPVLGAGAGLLYALTDSNAPGLGVLALCYGAVHVVDAMVINPVVVGKSLNLHPLTIIVGVTAGGVLGGILGMLVCIPLIAVLKAIVGTLMDAWRRHELV